MSSYRFFKVGEKIQQIHKLELKYDYIIELLGDEMYEEEMRKLLKQFGKKIIDLDTSDSFLTYLLKVHKIEAVPMEYMNLL